MALLPAVQAEQQLAEMLQGAMHYVVNGVPAVRGHESITRRAEQLLYQCSGDVESAITLAIHESELRWSDAARKVVLACIPFVGLAASTLDLLWSQLRLVATVASLYGHDVYASDVQYRILLCIVQGTVSYNGERSTVNLAAQQVSRVVVSNAVGLVAGSVVPVASIATSLVSLYGHDVAHAGGRARAHFAPHMAIDLQRLRLALYVYAAVQLVQPAMHLAKLLRALPLPVASGIAAGALSVGLLSFKARRWLYSQAHLLSPPPAAVSFAFFLAVECLRVLLAMRVGAAAHLSALALLSGRDHDGALAAYYGHQALCGGLTLIAQKAPDSVSPALKQAQISVQLALLIWPFTGLHLHTSDISRLAIVSSSIALLSLNTAVQELRRTDVAVAALGSQRVVQGVLVVLGAMGRVVVSPSELLQWVENAAPPPTLCVLLLAIRRLAIFVGLLHGALVRAVAQRGSGLCVDAERAAAAAPCVHLSPSLAVVSLLGGGEGLSFADGSTQECVAEEEFKSGGAWFNSAAAAWKHGAWPALAGDPCAPGGGSLLSPQTELLLICLALSLAMNVIWHSAPALGRFRIFVLLGNENTKAAMTKIAEWVRRYEIAMQPVASWGAWTTAAVAKAWRWIPGRVRDKVGWRRNSSPEGGSLQKSIRASTGASASVNVFPGSPDRLPAVPRELSSPSLLSSPPLLSSPLVPSSLSAPGLSLLNSSVNSMNLGAMNLSLSLSVPLVSESIAASASSDPLLLTTPLSSGSFSRTSLGEPILVAEGEYSISSLASTSLALLRWPWGARVPFARRLGAEFNQTQPYERSHLAAYAFTLLPDGSSRPQPLFGAAVVGTTVVAVGAAATGLIATSGVVVVGAGVCGAAYGVRAVSSSLRRRALIGSGSPCLLHGSATETSPSHGLIGTSLIGSLRGKSK
mmetsp:Transcript_43603/g.107895  ORF Transcript_43603/g.107895 Transcript_43603/m.107895 type:complete len:919 (-) Transcript_43603:747-3503(-)